MTTQSHIHHLLEQATAILPVNDEDLIYKGIATGISERMITLKRALARLQEKYGSPEALESRLQTEGVSPDDHTLYTDLLEWRAIRHESKELLRILEAM